MIRLLENLIFWWTGRKEHLTDLDVRLIMWCGRNEPEMTDEDVRAIVRRVREAEQEVLDNAKPLTSAVLEIHPKE